MTLCGRLNGKDAARFTLTIWFIEIKNFARDGRSTFSVGLSAAAKRFGASNVDVAPLPADVAPQNIGGTRRARSFHLRR
jgi:hypothetical protein